MNGHYVVHLHGARAHNTMALSFSQLEQLAKNAGFSSALASVMAAIALAESGGNPNATNPYDNNGTQTSWGLWQISYGNHNAPPNWSDPQTNADLAYQKYLSQGLGAWGTYTSGKYQQFMNGSTTSTSTTSGSQPWYTFPRIDNFGQIDPEGDYYKPDSNVITPPGYDITALLSGTITSVQQTSWGQTVITEKLDDPLNSEATHMFFEHMHDAVVSVGQHINAGDLLGQANYTGEGANLGVGLYSGDVYGSGPAWAQLQSDLAPGGPGLLNPTNLLNNFKNGILTAPTSYSTDGSSAPIIGPLIDWLQQTLGPTLDWLSNPTRIIKLVVGVLLVGVALFMLVAPEGEKVVKEVAPIAETAAMA